MSEDMSIDDLVKKINRKQKLRLSFFAHPTDAGRIEDKFAFFFSAVVRTGDPQFYSSVYTIIGELAKNSLHAPGVRAVMEAHVGRGGIVITYTDGGDFYKAPDVPRKIAEQCDLDRQLGCKSGFSKIFDAADEIEIDMRRCILGAAKYGKVEVVSSSDTRYAFKN